MAVTLLQFWQQQLAIYQSAQAAAQQDQTAAQQQAAVVAGRLVDDQNALAKTASDIAVQRALLAATLNPADAAPILAAITTLIIQQRAQQGQVLDDQDAAADAQAANDAATATLARAAGMVATIQTTIASVTLDDTRRSAYKTAVATAPLGTLKSDATGFGGSATVTHATTRMGKNFPAALLAIARKRRDARVNRLASLQTDLNNAVDALGSESAADTGLAGVATQQRFAFERAQDALATYVSTAATRFAQAKAVMTMLETIELDTTGTVPDVLTDAEKAQLTAQAAAGAAAETTAETLDTDLHAIFTAEDALDAQILTAIAADVDHLSTDAQVIAKRTAITTATTTFTSALTTFAAANKKDLDQWESTVPDGGWQVLLAYQDGLAALSDLSAADGAALASTLVTAEDAYTTALGAAMLGTRRSDAIGDAIALRQSRVDAARAALATRLPSAVRGDSY